MGRVRAPCALPLDPRLGHVVTAKTVIYILYVFREKSTRCLIERRERCLNSEQKGKRETRSTK